MVYNNIINTHTHTLFLFT